MGHYVEYVEMLHSAEGWQTAYPILEQAGKAALPDIIEGLKHPDWRVRKWCVAFMDHHADERCAELLIDSLTDPYADVRRHAVHSIGCQPCKDNPLCVDIVGFLVQRVCEDSSVKVRRSAVHMLGNQHYDHRAVQALERVIEHEQDHKLIGNAKWSLQQQKSRSLG